MQTGRRLVQQIHAERGELREPGDERRDLRQQLLEVQHARHLAAQLHERGEELGVRDREHAEPVVLDLDAGPLAAPAGADGDAAAADLAGWDADCGC